MKPIPFSESNKTLLKPSSMTDEECGSLHIYTDGKQCISCWEPTEEEIKSIVENKKVWISVHSGYTQPPILLLGDSPFVSAVKDNGR